MAGRFSVEAVFRAVDRITRPMARMTRSVDRFTRSTIRDLKRIGRQAFALGKSLAGIGKGLAVGGAIGIASAGTFVTMLNAASVESDALAKSVQGNVTTMSALAAAIKPAGLEFDHIVDLMEEMNNKFGESAGLEEILPVEEALDILGLKFKDIEKLSPEKQFEAITTAMLKMKDGAKAAAAFDILLGGEASKVSGILREQGQTLEQLIAGYERLNFFTDEGREGAADFTGAMNDLMLIIVSVSKQIAGLIGKQLAPMITQLVEWIAANKELVAGKIIIFVDKLVAGIRFLIDEIQRLNTENDFLQMFSDLSVVLGAIVTSLTAIVKLFKDVGTVIGETAAKIAIFTDSVLGMSAADGFLKDWKDFFDGFAQLVDGVPDKTISVDTNFNTPASAFMDDDAFTLDADRPVGVGVAAIGAAGQVGNGHSKPLQAKDKIDITINDGTGNAVVDKNTLGGGLKMNTSGAF